MKLNQQHGNAPIYALSIVIIIVCVGLFFVLAQNSTDDLSSESNANETSQTEQADTIIEQLRDNEFVISGQVTDKFNTLEVDGAAGVIIGDTYRIIIDIAREDQLFTDTPKGSSAVVSVGDLAEAYVSSQHPESIVSNKDNQYSIFGNSDFYIKQLD